jgi:PAS domain-containing protein
MREVQNIAMQADPSIGATLVILLLLAMLAGMSVAMVILLHRQRQRQSAERMTEATSRILLDTVSDPAYIIDQAGTILEMNDTARRVGHLSSGSSLFAPLPANLAASRRNAVEQVIHTSQPLRLEDVYEGWYSDVRMVPLHDTVGAVTRVAVTSRDVTEQRQLEATLSSTIQFLQQILESSRTIAIISTDRAGTVGFWNAGAQELFGYTSEEIVGERSITSLLVENTPADFARLTGGRPSVTPGRHFFGGPQRRRRTADADDRIAATRRCRNGTGALVRRGGYYRTGSCQTGGRAGRTQTPAARVYAQLRQGCIHSDRP